VAEKILVVADRDDDNIAARFPPLLSICVAQVAKGVEPRDACWLCHVDYAEAREVRCESVVNLPQGLSVANPEGEAHNQQVDGEQAHRSRLRDR
jgi:hypothetical protein